MTQASGFGDEKSRTDAEIAPKPAVLAVGRCRFDTAARQLIGPDGKEVPIRSQSLAVLTELARRRGEVVSKEALFEAVWPGTHVTDDSLVQCIADIRRAVGDHSKRAIETVPKQGYRLNAARARSRTWIKPWTLPILLAVLALVAALFLGLRPVEEARLSDQPRIAVLAFDDFSTGADRGYLSDAIAEGLITELARFPSLAVIARTSSFQYRDTTVGIGTIQRELRVDYVLEGSQQKAGDGLRVTAQLINARTGAHIWSDTYDRQLADLFAVQEEIVRSVAGIVGDIVERRPLPESDLRQVTAMRFFLNVRDKSLNREAVEARFEVGEEALAVDSDSEWGYLILGWAHRHMAVFFSTPEEKLVHLARAEDFADIAVSIAPRNHYGLWLRARVQGENGDHLAAIETYKQAIDLNPSATQMLTGSAAPLLYLGRFEEGLDVIDRALDLDPKHTGWFHWQRAWALWELDRCDEALASFRRMASIPSAAHRMLAATHACLGDKAAAEEALNVYLAENPERTLESERLINERTWPNQPSVERWMEHMEFAGMPAG